MSDGVLMWVGLALFALVFAGLWLILTKARKKRIAQLEAFAASQGWMYTAEDQSLLALSHDEPFGQGHSRTVQDVFNGTTGGHEFVSFQYIYKVTTGSGDQRSTETYRYMVTCIVTPPSPYRLEIKPEGCSRDLLVPLVLRIWSSNPTRSTRGSTSRPRRNVSPMTCSTRAPWNECWPTKDIRSHCDSKMEGCSPGAAASSTRTRSPAKCSI